MIIICRWLWLIGLVCSSIVFAAAPDDINSNQRAWYDAVDINGNDNYTDNPGNNSAISEWRDKSGNSHHVSSSGTAQPLYRHNTIGTSRHGIDFDGSNDFLGRNQDIWSGSVSNSEIFFVATTDLVKSGTLFSSIKGGNRLSTHVPWGDGRTYFDHGKCCGNPARISGTIPISQNIEYIWHFIGLSNLQRVVQDGDVKLSDSGVGAFSSNNSVPFTIAGFRYNTKKVFYTHNGRLFEGIFYQQGLNDAQRNILTSYLSAKWDKAFASSPDYVDVYNGDNAANGNYDFFVGGIGRDSGTQMVGTSQGLTITNQSFLDADGKYILAGTNYLTTTPVTGTTTSDLPSGYQHRANRTWYIDRTGSGGLASLSFSASQLGIPVNNGEDYGLLYKSSTSASFAQVANAQMSGGVVTFSHLPDDGIYTIGKGRAEVELSLQKTSLTVWDPVNANTNPKALPGAYVDYTLTVKNIGSMGTDQDTTIISDALPANLDLYVGDLSGTGSPFVFTDAGCAPTAGAAASGLSLNYPSGVVFKNASGSTITPTPDFDQAVRSFTLTFSGAMNASTSSSVPCFTVRYRTMIK